VEEKLAGGKDVRDSGLFGELRNKGEDRLGNLEEANPGVVAKPLSVPFAAVRHATPNHLAAKSDPPAGTPEFHVALPPRREWPDVFHEEAGHADVQGLEGRGPGEPDFEWLLGPDTPGGLALPAGLGGA
jgi:hypothetical protein